MKNMGSKRKEKMSEIATTEEQVDHGSLLRQSMEKSICYDSDSNSHHHHAKKNKNQNSNNSLLLEDLRIHIFTLVPFNCLLNSMRYVCKPWAETIGSSYFAQVCERSHAHSKLGLYVQNWMARDKSYFLEFKDYVNGEFERTDLGTPHGMGCLIGTCDDMLLLRNKSKQIFFVNPILKCWIRLPDYPIPQQCTLFKHQGTIARVPRTGKFKLFLADSLEVLGVFWFILYVLRIGIDNSWKEIFRKEAHLQLHYPCQTLYSGDNDLYWITKKVGFLIDVDKEIIVRECQLPYVPMAPYQKYILMGDRLSCIMSNDFRRTFQIYILNFDSRKFSLHHEMGPFDYVATCGHRIFLGTLLFRVWINNQIIFQVTLHLDEMVVSRSRRIHLGYNVKTRQLTKIEAIEEGNFDVLLHTNSLISLPNTLI